MHIAHIDLFPNALFNLFHAMLTVTSPPNLPRNKGERLKRGKSERIQTPYKEQKASNVVHLALYWNMLSFSFTIIEFSLVISFRVVM